MKSPYNKKCLIIALLFMANYGFSQSNEIKIKFIANCGLYMTDGNIHLYSDFPYKSGAHNYMEFEDSELDDIQENSIFLFTHKHADHYSKKNLKKVLKTKKGTTYGPWNIAELEKIGADNPDFSIQAFKAKHRFSLKHYSYLITWHGKKIFLSGDTEKADLIQQMSDLDWVFAPAWLLSDAHTRGIKIDAKMVGVYHIGPRDQIEITGETILMLKKQGEMMSIPY